MPHSPPIPAYLTLMQSVGWIMFRDPRVVAAGTMLPVDPDERAAALAWREADGGWLSMGDDRSALTLFGMSLYRLELAGWPDTIPVTEGALPAEHAIGGLLKSLIEGHTRAHGKHRDAGRSEPIHAVEWAGLKIGEPMGDGRTDTSRLTALIPHDGITPWEGPWTSIVIEREGLLRLWPADFGQAAFREKCAELSLAPHPDAPSLPARSGFIWAGDAMRLIAFGEGLQPPEGMTTGDAVAALTRAGKLLCEAAAEPAPDSCLPATGRPGRWCTGEVKGARTGIPAAYFGEPAVSLNLASWAVDYNDAQSAERYVAWRNADAPDWAEVQFRRADVEPMKPPSGLREATTLVKSIRQADPGIKYDDVLDRVRKAGFSARIAERAAVEANGGNRRQGRKKTHG